MKAYQKVLFLMFAVLVFGAVSLTVFPESVPIWFRALAVVLWTICFLSYMGMEQKLETGRGESIPGPQGPPGPVGMSGPMGDPGSSPDPTEIAKTVVRILKEYEARGGR